MVAPDDGPELVEAPPRRGFLRSAG